MRHLLVLLALLPACCAAQHDYKSTTYQAVKARYQERFAGYSAGIYSVEEERIRFTSSIALTPFGCEDISPKLSASDSKALAATCALISPDDTLDTPFAHIASEVTRKLDNGLSRFAVFAKVIAYRVQRIAANGSPVMIIENIERIPEPSYPK